MRVTQVRAAARCAVCHDALDPGQGAACARCGAEGHAECWADLGRCTSLGCASSSELRTQARAPLAWWRRVVPLAVGGLAMGATRAKDAAPSSFALLRGVAVVSVLGLIAAVALVDVDHHHGSDRRHRVAADMKALGDALDLFRVDCGYYPDSLEALWNRPANTAKWGPAPYLVEYPPTDPWGNVYLYRRAEAVPESPDGSFLRPPVRERVELVSRGADGRLGGVGEAQDLSSRTIDVLR